MSVFTRSKNNIPLSPGAAAYWLLALLWFGAAIGPILLLPLSGDETYHFYLSGLLKHGGSLFDQYWFDDKPGGMQLIYLILTPFKDGLWNLYAIKLFTIVYQLITGLAFYSLCKRCFGSAGSIAKVLLLIFILVYANPMVEGQFSNSDNFTVLWIILAAYFFLQRRHMLSALSIGICFCLKQNTALEILPSSLTLITQEFVQGFDAFGRSLVRAGSVVSKQFLVFLIPIGMILLYTVSAGTSGNFLATAFIDRIHSHLLHKDYGLFAISGFPIFKQSGILWLGLFGFMLDWPRWKLADSRDNSRGFCVYLLIWAISALISVWVGGYFFPHYFIEVVPVLVIGAFVFLTRISRAAFYFLIAVAILISQRFGVVGNSIAVLFCFASADVDRRAQADRNTWRPLIVLSCLAFTLNQNPLTSAITIIKARNRFMYYSHDDRDMLRTSCYLKDNGLNSVFVYDYTMQIYCLSGIVPSFRYGAKCQYINYATMNTDNLTYPNDDVLLSARRRELTARLRNGDFQYVVINFNTVRLDEGPQMRQILAEMGRFRVRMIFGNVWIYERSPSKGVVVGRPYRLERAIVDEKADVIEINIKRSGFMPESTMDLACGGMQWHYPENGIIFPMEAVQDERQIKITAGRRGFSGGNCALSLNGVLEAHSFNPLKVMSAQTKID